jgi:error-prone DNA polymerase
MREELRRRGSLGTERLFRHEELRHLAHGHRVTIAGLITGRQRPQTASGVTFVSLEDETGVQNLIITVSVFERFRHAVLFSKLALVRGLLEREGEVLHVLVHSLERLELDGGELPTKSRDFH